MNSVQLRQQTPYAPGYEASPQSALARHEGGAEVTGQADTQSNSAPPRAPMTPEQRGQLSAHRNIMNQPQPDAAASSQLKELRQENQDLNERIVKLSENVVPKIHTLSLQIENLTAQLNAKEQSTEKATPATVAGPQSGGGDVQNVAPAESSPTQDTVATQPSQPQGLSQLVQEQSLFENKVMTFLTNLTAVLDALKGKIEDLMKSISGKDTSKTEEVTDGKGTDGTPVSDAATTETSPSTPTDQSTAPYKTLADTQSTESSTPVQADESAITDESASPSTQTIEQLKQKNKMMLETIEAQEKSLNDTIAALQMQVDDLTRQLSAEPK
ncbi:hypothetical protein [Pseudomonas graminis]